MTRAGAILALMTAVAMGGCAVAQSVPQPRPPIREVAREERGEVVTVRDTRLDLRTGMASGMRTSTPAVPIGPVGLRVPITLGGEKKVEVPAEEITVRLDSGKMIAIVQELSTPPFAPGERVRVLQESRNEATGETRMQVVRE